MGRELITEAARRQKDQAEKRVAVFAAALTASNAVAAAEQLRRLANTAATDAAAPVDAQFRELATAAGRARDVAADEAARTWKLAVEGGWSPGELRELGLKRHRKAGGTSSSSAPDNDSADNLAAPA